MLAVAIAIDNPRARNHIEELLASVGPTVEQQTSTQLATPQDIGCQPKQVIRWLKEFFAQEAQASLLFISDLLLRVGRSPHKNLQNLLSSEFSGALDERPFGTIAIMSRPERVPDIDRTVGPDVSGEDFEHTMRLVVQRVRYLETPSRRSKVDIQPVSIRPLRMSNETELREYFTLRHRVYTIMGYLDEEVENSRSKLEINEGDVHSIHLGAFYDTGSRERLVGTTRIVTNDEPNMTLKETLEQLASNDPVVKQRLSEPYPLGLPIFQSYRGMNPIMRDIFQLSQSCGEVSRVIVDPEFRGYGISKTLLTDALRRSRHQGVERMFLECLRVHEKIYEEQGFRRIPGLEGPAVDVYRTMIAMELKPQRTKREDRSRPRQQK